MNTSYLMIENPGVANRESFTFLGASTKRESTNKSIIGTFGSGGKFAIVTLLRNELQPIIFAGNLKMVFGSSQEKVHDGIKESSFDRVFVKYSGKQPDGKALNKTEQLNMSLTWGSSDWNSTDFALREFVSNAIDRAIEQDEFECERKLSSEDFESIVEDYRKTATAYKNVVIQVVGETQVRAKAGYTRVFVPLNESILKFYINLNKWFLHFSEPESLNETILPKKDRNIEEGKTAVIYKRGVRIREVKNNEKPSLFDYNLPNLTLDESRNVNDYAVKQEAAEEIKDASKDAITKLFKSFLGDQAWEHTFYVHDLSSHFSGEASQKRRAAIWGEALESLYGENYVLGVAGIGLDVAARKGYIPVCIPEGYVEAAASLKLKTVDRFLDEHESKGLTIHDSPPVDIVKCFSQVWEWLEKMGKTFGKEQPFVKSFDRLMQGGELELGFYKDDTIFINNSLSSPNGEPSTELLSTVLEEIGHAVTLSKDSSRDFQEFFIQICVSKMKKDFEKQEDKPESEEVFFQRPDVEF